MSTMHKMDLKLKIKHKVVSGLKLPYTLTMGDGSDVLFKVIIYIYLSVKRSMKITQMSEIVVHAKLVTGKCIIMVKEIWTKN